MAFDHRFIRDWIYGHGLLQEPEEVFAPATRVSPVEAEGEFVQVIVQVLQAHRTLVRSHQPPLEEADHPMNARQQFRWCLLLAVQKCDLVVVAFAARRLVAQPTVGMYDTARFHRILYKS